jgi:hypothetical protein|tara:strand:+ start:1973 stop:2377 length:405 start_codon:yes stop_codon:yes gene_type:complete
MPNWTYGGKYITDISDMPEGTVGFVYRIRNTKSGAFYIGKKQLYSHRTLPPLKGTKRKRKVIKEMKWQGYQSSQSQVNEWELDDIEKTILRFCKSKKALTYYEVEEQIKYNVLAEEHSLNDNILGKFFRKDLEL